MFAEITGLRWCRDYAKRNHAFSVMIAARFLEWMIDAPEQPFRN